MRELSAKCELADLRSKVNEYKAHDEKCSADLKHRLKGEMASLKKKLQKSDSKTKVNEKVTKLKQLTIALESKRDASVDEIVSGFKSKIERMTKNHGQKIASLRNSKDKITTMHLEAMAEVKSRMNAAKLEKQKIENKLQDQLTQQEKLVQDTKRKQNSANKQEKRLTSLDKECDETMKGNEVKNSQLQVGSSPGLPFIQCSSTDSVLSIQSFASGNGFSKPSLCWEELTLNNK